MSNPYSPTIKEMVEAINSSVEWDLTTEIQELVNEAYGKNMTYDPVPITVVTYYPSCDCGEPALEEQVLMCKEITMYGYGYMDTCYECSVVSSD